MAGATGGRTGRAADAGAQWLCAALVCGWLHGCGDDPRVVVRRGPPDAGTSENGSAGRGDGGNDPSWQPPRVELPEPGSDEQVLLSQTGLYRDSAKLELAPDLIAYEPSHAQWSDGATKRHWLRLPEGALIDSSDVDHWQFPDGTMAFEELSLHGKRIETRLIARTGPGPDDYWMGAFLWNDQGSDARFTPDGANNARGTAHDVPAAKHCVTCHGGEPGRLLGFSAVQQPKATAALLSDPPLHTFVPPGDPVAAAALGYLHANCAPCHNPQGSAYADTDLDVRLLFEDRRVVETHTYLTTAGVALQAADGASPPSLRIAPGNAGESGIVTRMMERGTKTQMPPIASELADDKGIAAVSAWIERL